MSILISGMEMPKNCAGCFLRVGKCSKRIYMENRPLDCPLIEIPEPHGRLGDLDAIEKQIDYMANLDWNKQVGVSGGMLAALEVVEDAPTIIPANEECE